MTMTAGFRQNMDSDDEHWRLYVSYLIATGFESLLDHVTDLYNRKTRHRTSGAGN
jgi:hypothetical protein